MTSPETIRSAICLVALVATLAIAPVAPEAGNILFLAAGAVSLLFLRLDDFSLVRRPAVWMTLAGFMLLAIAYSVAAASPSGLAGLLFVIPMAAVIPLTAAAKRVEVRPFPTAVLALCGAAATAAIAVAEFTTTGSRRVGEWVANPIHFADLALSVGYLALLGTLFGRGAARWLFLLAPVLATVAVLLSGTRGAVIAVIVMGSAAAVTGLVVGLISLRQFALGTLALVIALVVGWFAGGSETSAVRRLMVDATNMLQAGLPADYLNSLRFQMYEGGLRAFLDAPIFGHGPFAFVEAAASRAAVPFEGAPHLHNDLADFAASGGVLGLIAYLLFLLAPLVEAHRTRQPEVRKKLILISTTLVAGYFTMGLTNAMFGILNLTVFYAAATFVIAAVGAAPLNDAAEPSLVFGRQPHR